MAASRASSRPTVSLTADDATAPEADAATDPYRLPTFVDAVRAWRNKCVVVPRDVVHRAVVAVIWASAVVDHRNRSFSVAYSAIDAKCRAIMLDERKATAAQTLTYADDCTPSVVLREAIVGSDWGIEGRDDHAGGVSLVRCRSSNGQ